ncbi:MAG: glycosyltransferase [Gammaproteobacteria bacterium]|nr:glycosyltransferase [Gammaproteobacteria bacterium]
MRFIKKNTSCQPKISLILLDWNVRESFHVLFYLSQQTLPRDQFEIIIVEYYSQISPAIQKFGDQADTWITLDMPNTCYYHKHLMYNVGILLAKGDIIIICDSDVLVKPTFLTNILNKFETSKNIFLHLDQFRNHNKDFYPFNFPSIEEVIHGSSNHVRGKTKGLLETEEPLHSKNYGACFCALKKDLIAIGGADEHIDFAGYICGPYDLSFRLLNLGKNEIWHDTEFTYHTWHPGESGTNNNYCGPNDGKGMSSTALEALLSQRIQSHVKNEAIAYLQQNETPVDEAPLQEKMISNDIITSTSKEFLFTEQCRAWAEKTYTHFDHCGHVIIQQNEKFYALPALQFYTHQNRQALLKNISDMACLSSISLEKLKRTLDKKEKINFSFNFFYILFCFLFVIKKIIHFTLSKLCILFSKTVKQLKRIFSIFPYLKKTKNQLLLLMKKNTIRVSFYKTLLSHTKSSVHLSTHQEIIILLDKGDRLGKIILTLLFKTKTFSSTSTITLKNIDTFLENHDQCLFLSRLLIVSKKNYFQYYPLLKEQTSFVI